MATKRERDDEPWVCEGQMDIDEMLELIELEDAERHQRPQDGASGVEKPAGRPTNTNQQPLSVAEVVRRQLRRQDG